MMDGRDCTCAARCAYDCVCGADWTPREVVELRRRVEALESKNSSYGPVPADSDMQDELDRLREAAREAIAIIRESYGGDDVSVPADDRVCEILGRALANKGDK